VHFHFSITILLKNRELSIQGTLIGDDCNVIRHIPVKYKIFFCVLELLHGTFEDSTRSIKIDDGLRSVHRFGSTAREQHFQLLRGTALMHQFDRACRTAVVLTRLSRHAFAKRPGPIAGVLMGKGGLHCQQQCGLHLELSTTIRRRYITGAVPNIVFPMLFPNLLRHVHTLVYVEN
jgi:hypothetical protein